MDADDPRDEREAEESRDEGTAGAGRSDDESLLARAEDLLADIGDGSPLAIEPGGALAGNVGDGLFGDVDTPGGSRGAVGTLVGERVGRVRLEELVGHGGMGEVYRGRDEVLDRLVAIKRVRPGRRLGDEAKARFFREARLLSQLDHPNICQLYDLIETPDGEFLLLEFIDGESLGDRIEEGLDRDEALDLAGQIAAALEAAHDDGVVHRDLKPDNVMVTSDGRAKVLDFGIARSTLAGAEEISSDFAGGGSGASGDDADETLITTHGQVLGTRRYMSPEQLRGDTVGAPSDLYSFGLVLHEMLGAGSALPDGPEEPAVVDATLDAELAALLHRLLAPEPEDRVTAAEARSGLDAFRARGERRRSQMWTAAAVVVGVVLLAAAFWPRGDRVDELLLEPGQEGRVLVAPFVNATGDPSLDWVEDGLSAMVADALDSLGEVEVASWEPVQTNSMIAPDEEGATPTAFELSAGAAREIARAIGAQLLIATRISAVPAGYRIDYLTHNVLGSSAERGIVVAELTQGAQTMATRIASHLGVRQELDMLGERFSEDPFVNRLFATGRHRFQTSSRGGEASLILYQAALEIDPTFTRARLALAQGFDWSGRRDEARRAFEEVVEAAEASGDRSLHADALRYYGEFLVEEPGRSTDAISALEAALEVERSFGDPRGEAQVLQSLGWATGSFAMNEGGSVVVAGVDYDRAAIEILRTLDDPLSRYQLHYAEAGLLQMEGELNAAEAKVLLAIEAAQAGRFVAQEGIAEMRYGWILFELERYEEGIASELRAIELHSSVQNWIGHTSALSNLSDTYEQLGRLDESLELAKEAVRVGDEGEQPGRAAWARLSVARVANKLERYPEALDALAGVDPSFRSGSAFYALQEARAHAGLGDWAEAVRCALESKAVFGSRWTARHQAELERYQTMRDAT